MKMGSDVERLLPDVWRLIRSGFVTRWESAGDGRVAAGSVVHIVGLAELDRAEALAVRVMFRGGCQRRTVLELLRAESFGRAVTLTEAAALELGADDIDRAIEGEVALRGVPVIPAISGGDAIETFDAEVLRNVANNAVEALGEDCKKVAERRWIDGKTDADAARELGIGRAAVRARERRIRHAVRHALRALTQTTIGPAAIDYLLSGTADPEITKQRVLRTISTKLQPEEPRSFVERLYWALGASAIALAGGILLAVYSGR